MTKEQARIIISNMDKAYRTFSKEEYKAIEVALKALEQDSKDDEIYKDLIQEKIKENEQRKVELLSDMMRMKALNVYDQCRRGEQE